MTFRRKEARIRWKEGDDMAHSEKKLSSKEIYAGRILRITCDTVELENGRQSLREMVHHPGGVGLVPVTEAGEVYMVRQFRYPFGRELLEIPAGKLEQGEDPETCGRRELREECGLEADTLIPLGAVYPSVGYDTEVIHLYLAKGLHPVAACPDEDEFLTPEKWKLPDLVERIMADGIRDAKTVAAILKVWNRVNRV